MYYIPDLYLVYRFNPISENDTLGRPYPRGATRTGALAMCFGGPGDGFVSWVPAGKKFWVALEWLVQYEKDR